MTTKRKGRLAIDQAVVASNNLRAELLQRFIPDCRCQPAIQEFMLERVVKAFDDPCLVIHLSDHTYTDFSHDEIRFRGQCYVDGVRVRLDELGTDLVSLSVPPYRSAIITV
jgi:hypothetical protein